MLRPIKGFLILQQLFLFLIINLHCLETSFSCDLLVILMINRREACVGETCEFEKIN